MLDACFFTFKLGVSESNENQTVTLKGFVIPKPALHLGVVNKLRLQKAGGSVHSSKIFSFNNHKV